MYDIFISFKSMDEDGMPTRDSVIAREIYDKLSGLGVNVFFSLVTLEKLGISAYKYAIDKALDSARILVAVGTSTENLDSQWVRYEWDSFLTILLAASNPRADYLPVLRDVIINHCHEFSDNHKFLTGMMVELINLSTLFPILFLMNVKREPALLKQNKGKHRAFYCPAGKGQDKQIYISKRS